MRQSVVLLSLDHLNVIAHRGGSKLRPENTLAAFDHAVTLGVDAIECDVQLSRDGEVVVIHDATLDRTTDARGPVSSLSAAELGRVDAGFHFGAAQGHPCRGKGVYVPRLAEASRTPSRDADGGRDQRESARSGRHGPRRHRRRRRPRSRDRRRFLTGRARARTESEQGCGHQRVEGRSAMGAVPVLLPIGPY